MSYIAPAGTPIALRDIWMGSLSGISRPQTHQELCRILSVGSRSRSCWTVSSGRAGMVVILRAMARAARHSRSQVVVPAYTCYSVPAAVRRAGLQPLFCDVDPRTLSLDIEHLRKLDLRNVLAIVSANLYGLPNDLVSIGAAARDGGAFLLDDAAQALGARLDGVPVGGFGDAGLFSFDRGKNVTTIQGGAIVARDAPIALELQQEWERLPGTTAGATLGTLLKLLVYSQLLRPACYGLVHKAAFLGLGTTEYDEHFPVRKYSKTLAGVAMRLCRRLDEINRARVENAGRLKDVLAHAPGIELIEPVPGSDPVYTRFPIRVPSRSFRRRVVSALGRAGIGATTSFPRALPDLPELGDFANRASSFQGAREVADSIVTLPTHAYCPAAMPAKVLRTIEECASH